MNKCVQHIFAQQLIPGHLLRVKQDKKKTNAKKKLVDATKVVKQLQRLQESLEQILARQGDGDASRKMVEKIQAMQRTDPHNQLKEAEEEMKSLNETAPFQSKKPRLCDDGCSYESSVQHNLHKIPSIGAALHNPKEEAWILLNVLTNLPGNVCHHGTKQEIDAMVVKRGTDGNLYLVHWVEIKVNPKAILKDIMKIMKLVQNINDHGGVLECVITNTDGTKSTERIHGWCLEKLHYVTPGTSSLYDTIRQAMHLHCLNACADLIVGDAKDCGETVNATHISQISVERLSARVSEVMLEQEPMYEEAIGYINMLETTNQIHQMDPQCTESPGGSES